jgi:hypothetical protein
MATVFISYASEQEETARRIELSLEGDGHSVFCDRSSLPSGESFDARIRAAIDESDLIVFLISRASISHGRYTLTELKFAEHKWAHPAGHVLPVLVEPVAIDAIPTYLRAVTILNPRGNLTAEVAGDVARMSASWWRKMLAPRRLVPPAIVVVAVLAAGVWTLLPRYLERREQAAQVAALVQQSQERTTAGEYHTAWKLLEQARTTAPHSIEVSESQERLAMERLRRVGVDLFGGDRSALLGLVDETLPALSRGATRARGERLADLLAHTGWAEYVRQLGGVAGSHPADHYRRALEVDSRNVYAHAMWGFDLLRERRSSTALADATRHFSAAVASERDRHYVRHVQIGALLQTYTNVWIADTEREGEALRVANEMRINGETRPKGWQPGSLRRTLWAIYHFDVVASDRLEPLLTALPPVEHLATFRWLFPEEELPESDGAPSAFNYLFVLAQLQEQSGGRNAALDSYRRLLREAATKKYDSSRAHEMVNAATAAIKRLSS